MQRYFLVILIIFGFSRIVLAVGPLDNKPKVTPPMRTVAPPTDKQIATEKAAVGASSVSSAESAEMASGDGQGYTDIEAQISKECRLLQPYARSINPASSMGAHIEKMVAACNAFMGFFGSQSLCIKSQLVSSKACLDSELLNNANIAVQLLGSVGSMAIQDSCSTIAKVMDISKNAFSLYTTACNAARLTCSSKCASAVTQVKTLMTAKTTSEAALNPQQCNQAEISVEKQAQIDVAISQATVGYGAAEATRLLEEGITECRTFISGVALPALSRIGENLDRELLASDRRSVAGKVKTCEADFGKMVASAGATGLSLLASYAQAKKCEQQTAAAQAAAPLNCNDPKNSQIPDCICAKSPRSVGCANSLAKASGSLNAADTPSSLAQASTPKLGTRSLGNETPLGRDPASANGKSAASTGSVGGAQAGAPVGGNGGSGGLGGSDGRGSGGKETPTFGRGSRFNTNVNSGYDGGGSGGFRRGGFGSEAEAKTAFENYKKGMDPVKVAAQAWAKEVSPQNGRSNFEKVKSRYNDNRRTLIGK